MEIYDRLAFIRSKLGGSQKEFGALLGLSQSSYAKYEKGANAVPDHVKVKLVEFGIDMNWLLTGEGPMFQDPNARASAHLPENPAAPPESKYDTVSHLPPPGREGNPQETFRIPILSRETARDFEPIGWHESKAHSGDFPDYMVVDVPLWLREYSSDLRAVMVFYDRMIPLLYSGDVAIIKATGWSGEGIYLYKSENQVHISHVRVNEGWQMEFESSLFESFHDNDAKIIGRVVAVLHPVYNRAIEAAELARFQLARQRERESKSPPKPPPAAASSKDEVHEPAPEYGSDEELSNTPLLGQTAAGPPLDTQGWPDEWRRVRLRKREDPRSCYLLEVKGTSMVDAGIPDRSLILVRRAQEGCDGQIVIAHEPQEGVTLKRLAREGDRRILQWQDGSRRFLEVSEHTRIQGVFIRVIDVAERERLKRS